MDIHGTRADGSIPVVALLFPDESLLAEQDSVGLYEGNTKSPHHQQGSIHVTSHRLIYIDSVHPRRHSLEFPLERITQTEFYAGFLTSSAKITLFFQRPSSAATATDSLHPAESTASTSAQFLPSTGVSSDRPVVQARGRETTVKWECEICGNKNVSVGLVPSTICQLCGVPRSKTSSVSITSGSSSPAPQSQFQSISGQLPPNIHGQAIEPRQIPAPRSATLDQSFLSATSQTSLSKSLPSSALPTRAGSPSPSRNGEVDGENQVPCPACTFLNYPSLRNCEMCGTALPKRGRNSLHGDSTTSGRINKSEPSSRPSSPDRGKPYDERGDVIKISFRKGGDKALYAALKTALEAKVWDVKEPTAPSKNRTGIHGLVQLQQSTMQTTSTNMHSALQDLEALMTQAREMVTLAESFNKSLKEHEATRQQLPEDAQFIIGSSMARLGLAGDSSSSGGGFVPADKGKVSEEKWLPDLAKELGRILTGTGEGNSGQARDGLMASRGMIALDEVWGAWNRVRGVALIPPSTFMQVLPLLAHYTSPPILTRAFHSNLKVVHTPWYSQTSFSQRLLTYLDAVGPKTTVQVAEQEGISVGLVTEMIGAAEREGKVVKDIESDWDAGGIGNGGGSAKEVTWWRNHFDGYVWDGD